MTPYENAAARAKLVERFAEPFEGMLSPIIQAHQLRKSANLMDIDTKRETGWADTSDRAEHMRKAADTIEALEAQLTTLRERLELTGEFADGPDGIECRDDTIKQQDATIARLRKERDEARELADRAISNVESAVHDTSWGQSTFGPDVGEELREEQCRILGDRTDGGEKA